MTKYYLSAETGLKEIAGPAANAWISMINPDESEIKDISEKCGIEASVLKSALDTDERSRIDLDDNYTMVLVNIPTVEEQKDEKELYSTIPLGIITTGNMIITVCLENTPVLRYFASGSPRDFRTNMKSRFILQILYQNALLYLQYLHNIDKKSDEIENILHKSTKNSELIELLKLEKSLVYFTTALRSNEAVLEKLLRTEIVRKYPEDSDLLEDVIVENKQAIEMTNIYSGILSGMMDAFASVISNNLNIVMKVLAIVTIVISIPTIIFSAYGMNLAPEGMVLSSSPYGFAIIIGGTLLLCLAVALIFGKIKMFK
ncbi:MAG TPA: magnesium transporter CorA family protein [Oscillospiraceae bacterium]|nr:magnesium transporter CorA family protein [Oscillospiraceae bacterium]HPS34157.1 magnesium transporter CorA family protein [Oscillospiraceae bacterium]